MTRTRQNQLCFVGSWYTLFTVMQATPTTDGKNVDRGDGFWSHAELSAIP